MPVVPFTSAPGVRGAPAQPSADEAFNLMAAAQMHSEGRLVEAKLSIDEATSGAPNVGGLRNQIQKKREELDEGLKGWDEKSKKFREELYDRGLMTPELEEIYNKRFGPRGPNSSGEPMS